MFTILLFPSSCVSHLADNALCVGAPLVLVVGVCFLLCGLGVCTCLSLSVLHLVFFNKVMCSLKREFFVPIPGDPRY